MIVVQVLAVALAGGVGAALRFVVDGLVRTRTSGRYPVATMVINVSGSLVLGLVSGLALRGLVTAGWQLVLGTGLMGGYTTFSTASVETFRLAEQRRPVATLANGLGMLLASVAAAALGLAAGLAV